MCELCAQYVRVGERDVERRVRVCELCAQYVRVGVVVGVSYSSASKQRLS